MMERKAYPNDFFEGTDVQKIIRVSHSVHTELSILKAKFGYTSISDTIKHILSEREHNGKIQNTGGQSN